MAGVMSCQCLSALGEPGGRGPGYRCSIVGLEPEIDPEMDTINKLAKSQEDGAGADERRRSYPRTDRRCCRARCSRTCEAATLIPRMAEISR